MLNADIQALILFLISIGRSLAPAAPAEVAKPARSECDSIKTGYIWSDSDRALRLSGSARRTGRNSEKFHA